MTNFGNGPILRQFSSHLRSPKKRWTTILKTAERNSVIEGLPAFTPSQRKTLLQKLKSLPSHS